MQNIKNRTNQQQQQQQHQWKSAEKRTKFILPMRFNLLLCLLL